MPLKPVVEKNPQNLPFLLGGMWTPSNTPVPGMTPFTTANDSSIASHAFTQLYNNVSVGYNGTPHIHPQNCALPWSNRQPQLHASSLYPADRPLQTASRSHRLFFLQYTRQTDRWDSQQSSYQYLLMLSYDDAT